MKAYAKTAIICTLSALALSACGGGGGSGVTVKTKAVSTVYLFGNVTSSANIIATVKTTINVPSGVLVNYSSAPGAATGLCKLRKGVLHPAGSIQLDATDFDSSSYDLATRVLTINMLNSGRKPLKSSASGKGAIIATVNFTLATPDILPTTMPSTDTLAEVGQETVATYSTSYAAGCKTYFDTTYQ